ncbi:MAG: YraN family protein [Cytophagaceae bacterium]
MARHNITGKIGEDLAADFLIRQGYEVITRNYRSGRGEIDIIATKDGVLVFIEVKVRKNINFGFPEETVTPRKEEMILTTAENYIFDTNWEGDIRFDILSIEKNNKILHFEDAF